MAAGLLPLVVGAASASADSVGPISFETPAYTVGDINGQDGWLKSGSYDAAIDTSTVTGFGAQSFRISNAVTSGSFGDQTFSKPTVNDAGEPGAPSAGMSGGTRQPFFETSWSFASATPAAVQPGLAVSASPDRGDGARMSFVRMTDDAGGLGVQFDEYDEDAAGGTGDFVEQTVASGLDRTAVHTLDLQMTFVPGRDNDIVKVCVDGTLCVTGGSWEDYFHDNEGPGTRPVDSVLFRLGGAAAPATLGKGFFIDNFTVATGPEPTPPPAPTVAVRFAQSPNRFGSPSFGDAVTPGTWVRNAVDAELTHAATVGTVNTPQYFAAQPTS